MKKCFSFIICLFIFSCNFDNNNADELQRDIWSLEFSRSENLNEWQSLLDDHESTAERLKILDALSKQKNPVFIPLLSEVFQNSTADTLKMLAVFGIGQTGSPQAEQALLNIDFGQQSLPVRRTIIRALAQCCSETTVNFIRNKVRDEQLRDAVLYTAAICARKRLDTGKIKQQVTDSLSLLNPFHAQAYFMNYAAKFDDLPKLISIAGNAEGITQKYILKGLNQLRNKNKNGFMRFLAGDSLAKAALNKTIMKILSGTDNWRRQLYALYISPAVADSSYIPLFNRFAASKNPHLKTASNRAYAEYAKRDALAFLLQQFDETKSWHLKGIIIKELAEIDFNMAYRYIMQNLDKGDIYFKGAILEALAVPDKRLANQTLHQFVNVDNPYLANTAFNNLEKLGRLKTDEVESMLNSEHYSSVATALFYYQEKNITIPPETLLTLYARYDKAQHLELQRTVIKLINEPDSSALKTMYHNAAHAKIKKILIGRYPQIAAIVPDFSRSPAFTLPPHLQPDSIAIYESYPVVEIVTEKGSIIAELYPDLAPLTCENFLHLAEKHFYDDLYFHRVIADFVIQSGDPSGTGWGGPDFIIPSEDNRQPFVRGSLGIATSGFDTGSSQFFICQSGQPHLDGNYTNFGMVIDGIEVVDHISPGDRIISITIRK